jgi:PHD/YefM family antitoxin component YafN of YafNO toxin-antitoxin module
VYTVIHNSASGLVAHRLEQPMETKSVGIREFRAGLAEFIDNKQPVAVTRHGQTVGFFIPTARPSQVDLQALRDAADKLEAVMSLSEDDVEAAVRDFDTLRKGAAARRRAQT